MSAAEAPEVTTYGYVHPVGPREHWLNLSEDDMRRLAIAGHAAAEASAAADGYAVGEWSVSVSAEDIGWTYKAEDWPELDEDLTVPPQVVLRFEARITGTVTP